MKPSAHPGEPIYEHTTSLASGIPLGGLGAGSVELRDDGGFHDWEIFNNHLWSGSPEDPPPDAWSEDAFFAVRAKPEGGEARVRLLYDDNKTSRAVSGWYDHAWIYNYPFLRPIRRIVYAGRYPFANLRYEDDALPVELSLTAFSPFIPFDAKNSALPLACFAFRARNPGRRPVDVSLMFGLRNFAGYDQDRLTFRHRVRRAGGATSVVMTADMDRAARTCGSMAAAALGPGVSVLPAWTDGRGLTGFPNAAAPGLSQLFYAFRDRGVLPGGPAAWRRDVARGDLVAARGALHGVRRAGQRWRAALARRAVLPPGGEAEFVFLMSWHFPNHYHYFDRGLRLGHRYERWFRDAGAAADYGARRYRRLRAASERFAGALFGGTLEPWFAHSLNAQLTTFPQSFWWTREGEVAAWEGSACCQTIPNIHTVWSSFQPLLFFPDLYAAMKRRSARFARAEGAAAAAAADRESPFLAAERARRRSQEASKRQDLGGWFDRRWQELGYRREDFAAADGRRKTPRGAALFLGSAAELLRDYLWTGDRRLVDDVWPLVRRALDGGIAADANGDGLPDGAISYLTYDHWFPPATNCYRGTMWLAELAAGAALADRLGETAAAARWRAAWRTGAASFDRLLWNGRYYDFCRDDRLGRNDPGCLADQVSGHLYLRLCGVPPVHPPARARAALRAVFRHNRRPEEGLLNGADPRGRTDWRYFARYSADGADEALSGQWVTPWTGTEYYVAATMIAEGLAREGLRVARDVYERYASSGMVYNHMECGEHYFRALAAWAMLPARQGLVYDAPRAALAFAPRTDAAAFDSILLLPGAWGRIRQSRRAGSQRDEIAIEAGRLRLRELTLERPAPAGGPARVAVRLGGERLAARAEPSAGGRIVVRLAAARTLRPGDRLAVTIRA